MSTLKNESTMGTVNDTYDSDVDLHTEGDKAESEGPPKQTKAFHSSSTLSITKVPSTISTSTQSKGHLTGIPEEIRADPNQSTEFEGNNIKENTTLGSLDEQSMSISNFRKVQGGDFEQSLSKVSELKRDMWHTSIIQMKPVDSESSVQTGRYFKRSSTFVITPGTGRLDPHESDAVNIRLIDRPNAPELFIELDCLQFNPQSNNYYWLEKSRWLKFEENFNQDSQRFDNPHLAILSIAGVKHFRELFTKGEVVLDCHADDFSRVLDDVANAFAKAGAFTESEVDAIREALSVRHFHRGETLKASTSDKSLYRFDPDQNCFQRNDDDRLSQSRKVRSNSRVESLHSKLSHLNLEGRLESGTEALSIQVGALPNLGHAFSLLVRLDPPRKACGWNEVSCPLRFIYFVFGPKSQEVDLIEIGRTFAVIMSNPEYREVGYAAAQKHDFLAALKVFVSNSMLIPFNRLMTYDTVASMLPQMKIYLTRFLEQKLQEKLKEVKQEIFDKAEEELRIERRGTSRQNSIETGTLFPHSNDVSNVTKNDSRCQQSCQLICPPFRYFIGDLRGLKHRFWSDFRDAFAKENAQIVFVGIIFIYFVVMAPAITFGSLLNMVNPRMTVTMMLLASGFFQLVNTLFGGQPFEIVGITGCVYAVEKTLGALSLAMNIDLGAMRLWIAVYVAALGFIFVALNGVIIVKHIRRSVEEIYNFLVAAIYILSAIFNMFKALPYSLTPASINGSNINIIVAERTKFGIGGSSLFLAFFMANFCLILVAFRKGSFFRRQIRNLLGSLNVPMGIVLIIAIERIFFRAFSLPTLNIPPSNEVNFSLWFNIPSMASIMSVTLRAHLFCFLISLSLFAIITCEVACNGLMVSKSERKLLKPPLYSINLFLAHVVFPLLSGILGWPFISGGTVRSHVHCMAMSKWSNRLPGVPVKVIGAAEQRISGSVVGLLVILSVFLGSVLHYIPIAAMYGMFLYMGIMGAIELVFIRRFINMCRRRKYWNPHDFLKGFPTWHIMTFVLIQISFVWVLIILDCIAEFTTVAWTPLLFSMTILTFGLVRAFLLPLWPRLNEHLSQMDKKHRVQLYADRKKVDQVIVTVDEGGLQMKVVQSVDVISRESESDTDSDPGIH